MSIKSKVFAATAALTLIGGVSATGALTAGTADAATPSCSTCGEFFSQQFGTFATPNFVLDTLRQGEKAGQPEILFRASNLDPAEDYSISDQGYVSNFYLAGLVSASVAVHYGGLGCLAGYTSPSGCTTYYPNLLAYEIEYSPYGVDSNLCVGVGTIAAPGTEVTLQPCGVTSKTVWIADTSAIAPDTTTAAPLINGSDTNFSEPYVLTYPTNSYPTDMPRAQLYVTNLTGSTVAATGYPTAGTVTAQQLWGQVTGPLTFVGSLGLQP